MAGQRIVVVGGSGKVALAFTRLAHRQQRYAVSSLVRNEAHFDAIRDAGGAPRLLSIEDATVGDLKSEFEGVQGVLFAAGAGGKGPKERTSKVDEEGAIKVRSVTASISLCSGCLCGERGPGRRTTASAHRHSSSLASCRCSTPSNSSPGQSPTSSSSAHSTPATRQSRRPLTTCVARPSAVVSVACASRSSPSGADLPLWPCIQTQEDIDGSKKAHEAIGAYYECVQDFPSLSTSTVSLCSQPAARAQRQTRCRPEPRPSLVVPLDDPPPGTLARRRAEGKSHGRQDGHGRGDGAPVLLDTFQPCRKTESDCGAQRSDVASSILALFDLALSSSSSAPSSGAAQPKAAGLAIDLVQGKDTDKPVEEAISEAVERRESSLE